MILDDKSYIRTPKKNVSLMHYLGLTELISIFKNKSIFFSTCQLYQDQREGALTEPSYNETLKNLLWEDNTPVKKDDSYSNYKEDCTAPLNSGHSLNQDCGIISTTWCVSANNDGM